MNNKIIVLVAVILGIIVVSVSVVTADYAEISVANNFSLSGRVRNSSLQNASDVNITIYGVTMQQNGPPLETPLSSLITNSTGIFNVTNINNSYSVYSIKLLVNDSSSYTEIGPMLPPLPQQALQMGLENSTFYLVPAATIYLYAYNTTNTNLTFNYMVMDNSIAYPVKTSTGLTGLVWNATVAVERNRNYTIMIMRDQSAVVNNLSSYNDTNYRYTLGKNLSFSFYNLTGFIDIAGNDSEIRLKDIIIQLTPISGMVFPNSNFAIADPTINNMTGNYIANYSVLVLGAASGMEYIIEFYGNGSGEYYAAFQNISVAATKKSPSFSLSGLSSIITGIPSLIWFIAKFMGI